MAAAARVWRRPNKPNQIRAALVVANNMKLRPPGWLPLACSIVVVLHFVTGTDAGASPAPDGERLFEAFVDEQVAAVWPLHLGLSLQVPGDGISDHLDSLAWRLLAAVEGPDGVIMRASLIEALQLGQLPGQLEPGDNDDERRGDQGGPLAAASRSSSSSSSSRAHNWHRTGRSDARLVEFRRAIAGLKTSIKSGQLEHMLNAFEVRQLGAHSTWHAKRAENKPQGDASAEAVVNLGPEDKERLAEITKHVNETITELAPDERLRFQLATVEAYGLETLACGELGNNLTGHTKRVKRHLIASSPGRICGAIARAPRVLAHLLDRAIQLGLEIFDRLSATSQFLESMPLIGERVREMRSKAEPLIAIIEEVRHLHYLFKVRSCPNGVSLAASSGTSCLQESRRKAETKAHDGDRGSDRIKQMLSKGGEQALSRVTIWLIRDLGLGERFIKSSLFDEIVSRNAYALMVGLLAPGG